jgi:hypothetical protein
VHASKTVKINALIIFLFHFSSSDDNFAASRNNTVKVSFYSKVLAAVSMTAFPFLFH